jgi:hypothetical protein
MVYTSRGNKLVDELTSKRVTALYTSFTRQLVYSFTNLKGNSATKYSQNIHVYSQNTLVDSLTTLVDGLTTLVVGAKTLVYCLKTLVYCLFLLCAAWFKLVNRLTGKRVNRV